jgi:hypothetical protein
MLAHPGERTCWWQIGQASHGVFTDFAVIAPELEAAGLMTPAGRIQLIGAMSPVQSVPLVRDYVVSFFTASLSR